jgi:hypothetical protein
MGAGLYNLLFNYKTEPSWFEKELPTALESVVKTLEANAGVVVLKNSLDRETYMEYASYGYGEEGYFYKFLTRGEGNFEKIKESVLPVLFSSREYSMFYEYTDYCIVSRVLKKSMLGFVLFEFTGEYKELNSVFITLFADKLAEIYEETYNPQPKERREVTSKEGSVMEALIKSSPSLGIDFSQKAQKRILYIKGGQGSGKKTLSKYIYKTGFFSGDFIVINSLPTQLLKLEKSLYDWYGMVGNGIIVLDEIGKYTLSQQRLLYEFLLDAGIETKFHFIQDEKDPDEVYKPFFKLIEENSITIPNLNAISEVDLHEIICRMFDEVLDSVGRQGIKMGKDSLQFLSGHYYTNNLKELKNILEHAILKTKTDYIEKEDLELYQDGELKDVGTLNAEDLNLRRCVDALERQKILLANKLFAGNQVRMAKALGISRGSLQYKMKHMEL